MADEDDNAPRLRVDRLALAMEAARARARHGEDPARRLPPLVLDTPVDGPRNRRDGAAVDAPADLTRQAHPDAAAVHGPASASPPPSDATTTPGAADPDRQLPADQPAATGTPGAARPALSHGDLPGPGAASAGASAVPGHDGADTTDRPAGRLTPHQETGAQGAAPPPAGHDRSRAAAAPGGMAAATGPHEHAAPAEPRAGPQADPSGETAATVAGHPLARSTGADPSPRHGTPVEPGASRAPGPVAPMPTDGPATVAGLGRRARDAGSLPEPPAPARTPPAERAGTGVPGSVTAPPTSEPTKSSAAAPGDHDARPEPRRPTLTRADLSAPPVLPAQPHPAPLTAANRPAPAPRGPTLLALRAVSVQQGDRRVLEAVDLDVATGAVTALIGPPGSGASALLRAIMGLDRVASGRVRLGGVDSAGWSPQRASRAGIGYLPGHDALFPGLSVAQHLQLGERRGRDLAGRSDWLASHLPFLRTRWRDRVETLPQAERRLTALARTLVGRHRLYLLDAPSRGLDPDQAAGVVAALRDMVGQGAAVLLADAMPGIARTVATTGVALAGGRVVWAGDLADLLEDRDRFDRLAGLAMGPT